jgi:hypothetical protein
LKNYSLTFRAIARPTEVSMKEKKSNKVKKSSNPMKIVFHCIDTGEVNITATIIFESKANYECSFTLKKLCEKPKVTEVCFS